MSEPAYLTWSNKSEFSKIAASMGKTVDSYNCVYKSKGSIGNRTFTDFDSNISVRSEYNRADYEHFRKNEARPYTEEKKYRIINEGLSEYSCGKNSYRHDGRFYCSRY